LATEPPDDFFAGVFCAADFFAGDFFADDFDVRFFVVFVARRAATGRTLAKHPSVA